MSLLEPEALQLISAAVSDTAKKGMSLRDAICLAAHTYLKTLFSVVQDETPVDGDIRTSAEYYIAKDVLQDLMVIFGINVDLETLQPTEGVKND